MLTALVPSPELTKMAGDGERGGAAGGTHPGIELGSPTSQRTAITPALWDSPMWGLPQPLPLKLCHHENDSIAWWSEHSPRIQSPCTNDSYPKWNRAWGSLTSEYCIAQQLGLSPERWQIPSPRQAEWGLEGGSHIPSAFLTTGLKVWREVYCHLARNSLGTS